MATIVAQVENLSRLFGRFAALRKISVSFSSARCYVLLGENGAGKSTLLRVLAGLLEPSIGTVRICLEGADGAAAEDRAGWRSQIGYMSHAPMLYDELTACENLRYFADLYRSRRCLSPEEALGSVGLDPKLNRAVGNYSQGMRQRTSLARVLLPQPELLLLDEPFSNMDAASAHQMLSLIARLRDRGRTIILTTHQRQLAEPLADYLLMMEAGSLVSVTEGPALAGRPHSSNMESNLEPRPDSRMVSRPV